jgi:hypothetical protein
MVRRLCEQVANEQDPEKSKELLSLLRAVIHDAEEIKLRMSYLTKRYAGAFSDVMAAD